MRTVLAPSELDYVSLSAGDSAERDVWAEASQFPLIPGGNRMILIRNAEKLKNWDQLELWLTRTRQLTGVYLVFVSNDKTLPYANGKQGVLLPHAAALKAPRGSLVKCSMPKQQDAVAWVQRRATMDASTAQHLLARTGGSLTAAAHVCAKLALFDGMAGAATVDALVNESPAADFAENLIALDRKRALLCIPDLTFEHAKLVALLDSRLDLLQTLHRAQIAGQGWRDSHGVNPYLARQYLPHARHYPPTTCAYRRRVLAVIDDALRNGARVGVFEALVALW